MQNIEKPLISIVTVCYNEKNLERTCKSITSQTFKNFEWIVIDGGSNQQTIETFEKYKSQISVFKSEKDNGIYDAMNRGIKLSSAKWLIFMNAGDEFYKNTSLEKASKEINKKNADILYFDAIYQNKDGSSYLPKFPDKIKKKYWLENCICHQSTFIKKDLFDKFGPYDENFKIASDLEKWLHFKSKKCKFYHINEIISVYYTDGTSSNEKLREEERKQILLKYHIKKPLFRSIKNWFFRLLSLNRN